MKNNSIKLSEKHTLSSPMSKFALDFLTNFGVKIFFFSQQVSYNGEKEF